MNKRCSNCGKFPFCKIEPETCNKLQNWVKREVQMKLDSKKGEEFDFRRIEK